MTRMVWTFSDIYTKVSEFLGLGSSPTGSNLTKVKELVYRAYMRFLMPISLDDNSTYTWSFCTKDAVLLTKDGVYEVSLPIDFEDFVCKLTYGPDSSYSINEVTPNILKRHRAYSDTTAYPYEYAVKQSQYSPKTGQRKIVQFFPTPDAQYEFVYSYSFIPEKPENDSDYFVGGALASECILEMALAEAELQEDELDNGPHQKEALKLLNSLLKQDMPKAPKRLPVVVDGAMYKYDPFRFRADQINRGPMTVYGEDFD